MAPLPVFPSFASRDHSLSRLNQLSYATLFACRAPVVFHLAMTANQNVPIATQTPLAWQSGYADSDGGWDGGTRYIARTPGYFDVDAGANCAGAALAAVWQVSVRVTTGAGNPLGPGLVTYAAVRNDITLSDGLQESVSLSCTTPYLFAGDYMEVVVFCSRAASVTANWNTSGNNDLNGNPDGGPWFTGMLASLGP